MLCIMDWRILYKCTCDNWRSLEAKKRSIIVNIDQSFLIWGAGMEICSVALHVLHLATRLIINNLTTDNILSLTKYCQWFSRKLRIHIIFRRFLRKNNPLL